MQTVSPFITIRRTVDAPECPCFGDNKCGVTRIRQEVEIDKEKLTTPIKTDDIVTTDVIDARRGLPAIIGLKRVTLETALVSPLGYQAPG